MIWGVPKFLLKNPLEIKEENLLNINEEFSKYFIAEAMYDARIK